MILSKKIANEIAEEAMELQDYGTLCSTGYYVVYENLRKNICCSVDICKEKDNDREWFALYIAYDGTDDEGNDIQGDMDFTSKLDKDELAERLLTIAQDAKTEFGNKGKAA